MVYDYTSPDKFEFTEKVLSNNFDIDFNKAVEGRIDYYKKRDSEFGTKSPISYLQDNSKVGALALKKLIIDIKTDDNLVGPRLPNGNFYSNQNEK